MSETIKITITKHELKAFEKDGEKKFRVELWDSHKKKYSYIIRDEDGEWAKLLRTGNTLWVNVEERPNPKYPKFPFRNIYKPDLEQVPDTPPQSPPPTLPDTIPEPPAGFFSQQQPPVPVDEPKKYRTEKDIEIRWQLSMKCASWIVAGMDLKKMGEPEIKNLLITYINFFNDFQPGMTYETLPIGKAQIIELHNRLTYHGIAKLYYHEVLSKILGKKVIKTTDLTYQEAAKCIREFDETLDEMREPAEGEDTTEPVNPEDDGDSSLPF